MNIFDDILEKFIDEIKDIQTVEYKDIPNIDLYMDQVTTFIDEILCGNKRYPDDKILTKTMINNYAKAKIFPPPIKKKYTKNHLMLLIIIYHLKTVFSIHDISLLLKPVTDELNAHEHSELLEKIYSGFVHLQKDNQENISDIIAGNYEFVLSHKDKLEEYEDEKIKLIMTVLLLSIQANTEKRLAEKILDTCFQK